MPTILLKKSDTPGSVPGTANLTNLAGGVEVAVNTADKRVYSMTSASAVIELGTNPSSLTCADVSATVFRSASATITNLIATSASITTLTNNPTFGAGTANGVLYLNGSKVATSGSALVFDGTNLGIGTASPSGKLDVLGGISSTSDWGNVNITSRNAINATNRIYTGLRFQDSGAGDAGAIGYAYDGTGYNVQFATVATVGGALTSRMTLDRSGNLGIGTASPGATLDVAGNARSNAWIGRANGSTPTADAAIYRPADNSLGFSTANTLRATIDSSGNLGLGVTPSASTIAQFEGGSNLILVGRGNVYASNNATFNSSWKYIGTAAAAQYNISGAEHRWFTAPSGTANSTTIVSGNQYTIVTAGGNFTAFGAANNNVGTVFTATSSGTATGGAATQTIVFTQAMTLDASGNLLVGITGENDPSGAIVRAGLFSGQRSASASTCFQAWNQATTGDNVFVQFYTEGAGGTLRGSIDYNRAGGLVRYNTTSDYRAKEVYGLLDDSGETIDALKVYRGKMHGATMERPMLIAHEAQETAPYAVTGEKDAVNDDGDPIYQQMDTSSLVPLLIAEIQSLRSRVAALEAK